MATIFPSSPTVGQHFTNPGGETYVWDGQKWLAATTTASYQPAPTLGRNLIHNPLFNVQQRGTGPWTTAGYTADRWLLQFNLDSNSVTCGPQNDAGRAAIGDEAALQVITDAFTGNAGAGAYSILSQRLEKIGRLSGKTVIVSFWALASAATIKVGVGFAQNFGTGGSPSAQVTTNGTAVQLGTSWARYSVVAALPSMAGKTLGTNGDDNTELDLWLSAGSNYAARSAIGVQAGSVLLWGVQLEIVPAGTTVPTALEKPDLRFDLNNCQRFFQTGYAGLAGYGATGNNFGAWLNLLGPMRATPSVVLSGQSYGNASGAFVSVVVPTSIDIVAICTATGGCYFNTQYTVSADL